MKNYKYILFDLDGTLTDPSLGITKSVEYALKKFEIPVENREELEKFIGPPLINSFMEFYDFDKEKAVKAVAVYREYFSVKGIFENKIYAGIEEMLQRLKKMGKIIILATSKPEKFAKQILEFFKIDKYFDLVCGATMDEKLCEKNDIIRYALSKIGNSNENAIMVGDRKFDILGAKENGIDSIGVTYGFGNLDELNFAGADYIISAPEEIFNIIS